MDIEELGQRIQTLEDIEAIKKLKARYCAAADERDEHHGHEYLDQALERRVTAEKDEGRGDDRVDRPPHPDGQAGRQGVQVLAKLSQAHGSPPSLIFLRAQ